MNQPSSGQSFRELPVALLKNRRIQVLGALLIVLGLYNHEIVPLYVNAQKSVEATAIADNARLRQKAEAATAEWKAITESEIATHAARKQSADARKATADARKTKAEAVIARETQRVADIKAKGEAEAAAGEAAIKEQQVVVERERAVQAMRLSRANALAAQYAAATQKVENWLQQKSYDNPGAFARDAMDASMRRIFPEISQGENADPAPVVQNGAVFRVKSEVSNGKLNLREGPGLRHSIVVELPIGTLLRQIGACVGSDDGVTRDPWCKVDWNGTNGWASTSGLEKVQGVGNE